MYLPTSRDLFAVEGLLLPYEYVERAIQGANPRAALVKLELKPRLASSITSCLLKTCPLQPPTGARRDMGEERTRRPQVRCLGQRSTGPEHRKGNKEMLIMSTDMHNSFCMSPWVPFCSNPGRYRGDIFYLTHRLHPTLPRDWAEASWTGEARGFAIWCAHPGQRRPGLLTFYCVLSAFRGT